MSREIQTNSFRVKSDTGREYIVLEYQEFISSKSFDNPNDEIPGLKRLVTSTGLHVNYIDNETYKIVEFNEIARKV